MFLFLGFVFFLWLHQGVLSTDDNTNTELDENGNRVEYSEPNNTKIGGWWQIGRPIGGSVELSNKTKIGGWWLDENGNRKNKRQKNNRQKLGGWIYKNHTKNKQQKNYRQKISGWWLDHNGNRVEYSNDTRRPPDSGWWINFEEDKKKRLNGNHGKGKGEVKKQRLCMLSSVTEYCIGSDTVAGLRSYSFVKTNLEE